MTVSRIPVVAVMPEPTPYRSPLFDLLAARPELDLAVVYNAGAIAGNAWQLAPGHPHVVLRGLRVPGARRLLRHDYSLTLGAVAQLERRRPRCVVVTGWSTFASQAAIAWCRMRRVPYVLIVESHDRGPRRGWRRAVRGAVVPRVVRNAASVLVAGSLARESVVANGADPSRVRVFANTVDVERFAADADNLRARRGELRSRLGLDQDDVAVLSVARLAPEKGLDTLLQAVAVVKHPSLRVLVAGAGPERAQLERLAASLRVDVMFLGVVPRDELLEAYVAADVFALLSRHEPWAAVVNEAASCGLPLVLSDRVGAAHDLLRDGENGFLVPADDVVAAARALRVFADDAGRRAQAGARSVELTAGWGYEPSADAFVEAVLEAVGSTLAG
jgi:glycosyltransferase involved in cell wall biosynthesis